MATLWTFYEKRIEYTLLRNATTSAPVIQIVTVLMLEQMEGSDVLLIIVDALNILVLHM